MLTPLEESPFGLIQERFRNEPWKLLVCCVCLNLTNIIQVRPIIDALFARYPDPASLAVAEPADVIGIIRPLGLFNRRARSLQGLSRAFVKGWSDIDELPGVGKYAADSYRIFVERTMDGVEPTDTKLVAYVKWARERS